MTMQFSPEVAAALQQAASQPPGPVPGASPNVSSGFTPQQAAHMGMGLVGSPQLPGGVPQMMSNQQIATSSQAGPVAHQWYATQQGIGASQNLIDAQRNELALQPKAAAAKAGVYDAQEKNNAAQAAYLAEQTRSLEARRAENAAIQQAEGNVGDILSVARMQNHRNELSYQYRLAGVATPVEVKLPPGFSGPMPAGVVSRLQTLAEILTDASNDKEQIRKFNEEAARIKSANSGLEVTAKQIASGRVSLELEEAELAVSRAQLEVNQASLNLKASTQPPAPGYEWDLEAMEWVPALELKRREEQRAKDKQEAERIQGLQGHSALYPISNEQLTSMLAATYAGSPNGISEGDFRAVMKEKGFLDTTIEVMVRRARMMAEDSTATGVDDGAFGTPITPGAGSPAAPSVPSAGGAYPSSGGLSGYSPAPTYQSPGPTQGSAFAPFAFTP